MHSSKRAEGCDSPPLLAHLHSCRVEEGRGFRLRQSRFPSPLIERSMRISRTALSDWLHLGPVGGAPR